MVTVHCSSTGGPVASGAVGGRSLLRPHRHEDKSPAFPNSPQWNGKGGGDFLNEQSLSHERKLDRVADNVDDPFDWRQPERHAPLE